jgi:putative transposon-encoded protein
MVKGISECVKERKGRRKGGNSRRQISPKRSGEGNAGALSEKEAHAARNIVKLEIFGEEVLEKWVKPSGASGRIYLPSDWIGRRVKVIRLE